MLNRFVRKLEKFEKLSKTDRQAILDARQSIRKAATRKVLLERGDWSYLFVAGLACRYQLLEDGTRQITVKDIKRLKSFAQFNGAHVRTLGDGAED